MRSIASITIAGHVGKDPSTPMSSNPNFITFSVGVSSSIKTKEGTFDQKTDWYNCFSYRENLVELIKAQVHKGTGVIIIGSPSIRSYFDKEGKERLSMEINIEKISIVNKEFSSENQDIKNHFIPQGQRDKAATYYSSNLLAPQKTSSYMDNDIDDNIPF